MSKKTIKLTIEPTKSYIFDIVKNEKAKKELAKNELLNLLDDADVQEKIIKICLADIKARGRLHAVIISALDQ